MKNRKYPIAGIGVAIIYFISMTLFLCMKSSDALKLWEIMTVVSAFVILLILAKFCDSIENVKTYRDLAMVSMACACVLTSLAHIVDVTVTQRLLEAGVDVPTYLQIGMWPSVEMTVDYLGWGLFTGLAFAFASFAIAGKEKEDVQMKRILLINAILCLIGFLGAFCINENVWYVAAFGYGPGFVTFCIQWIRIAR